MSTALETALYDTLIGDETLLAALSGGVHNTIAPLGTAYPYLVFHVVSGEDDYTFTLRVETIYLVDVRVIGCNSDKASLTAALDQVDALLTDGALTVGDEPVWYVRRERRMPDAVDVAGANTYIQVGATFRIDVGG